MLQVTDPLNSAIKQDYRLEKACCGTLQGKSASRGAAAGAARILKSPADTPSVQPGDVLILPDASPSWIKLLRDAAAVVTERGGALSSLAIIARESRLPVIIGVADATELVPYGSLVEVDATAGTFRWHVAGHKHR